MNDHPTLNVLINNAGIMLVDEAGAAIDKALLTSAIETNLIWPIRMSSALINHLKRQDHALVVNVSSALGFVPAEVHRLAWRHA